MSTGKEPQPQWTPSRGRRSTPWRPAFDCSARVRRASRWTAADWATAYPPVGSPRGELRVLLQHPAATSELRRAALQELVHLATQQRGGWTVGVAGVLLPGLRRISLVAAGCRPCRSGPAGVGS